MCGTKKIKLCRNQRLNPRLYDDLKGDVFVHHKSLYYYLVIQKEKHIIARDMLDQSDPDSDLDTEAWISSKLSRPKVKYIVKSCMALIPLAGKSEW